jgi:hypothetical protein
MVRKAAFLLLLLTQLFLSFSVFAAEEAPFDLNKRPFCGDYNLERCCKGGDKITCITQLGLTAKSEADIEKLKDYCYVDRLAYGCQVYLKLVTQKEKNPRLFSQQISQEKITQNFEPCRLGQAGCDQRLLSFLSDLVVESDVVGSLAPTKRNFRQSSGLLKEKSLLCQQTRSLLICEDAAVSLWQSGLLADSLSILHFACGDLANQGACQRIDSLKDIVSLLGNTGVRVGEDVKKPPCGRIKSFGSPSLNGVFSDYGIFKTQRFNQISEVQDGYLVVGNQIVLRYIGQNIWVGVDQAHLFTWLSLETEQKNCLPPKKHTDKPPVAMCSVEQRRQDMGGCCLRGGSTECLLMGNRLAARGDSAAAVGYFAKACEAGVKVACSNVTFLAMNENPNYFGEMNRLCQKSSQSPACVQLDLYQPEDIDRLFQASQTSARQVNSLVSEVSKDKKDKNNSSPLANKQEVFSKTELKNSSTQRIVSTQKKGNQKTSQVQASSIKQKAVTTRDAKSRQRKTVEIKDKKTTKKADSQKTKNQPTQNKNKKVSNAKK